MFKMVYNGKLSKLAQEASSLMDKGSYEEALKLVTDLDERQLDDYDCGLLSALLIDIGWGLRREEVTMRGIEVLKTHMGTLISTPELAAQAYYNLANGFYILFQFQRIKDEHYPLFRKTELDGARDYYKKALDCVSAKGTERFDATFISQIWVNLANCYDSLGRVIDALECYDEALKVKPDHGMALGNKGIALHYYALVSDYHQATYMIEAYSLFRSAIKSGVTLDAVKIFSDYLSNIRLGFKETNVLEQTPSFPGISIKTDSDLEKFLIDFCLTNKLYLNICNFCQKCEAAIGDTAIIRKMVDVIPERNSSKH